MSEPHVLIIGTGITGLLIAHGLKQAGIRYSIFEAEKEDQLRTKEWTIGIHWGLCLLESLLPPDLAARIDTDASVDPSLDRNELPSNGACIYDGVNGELLKDLTLEGRSVRVSRQKLRRLFRECLAIHWSHTLDTITCSEVDGTVTASFTNGASVTGSLLVGTDGPWSTIRTFLFAHDLNRTKARELGDIVASSMVVSYDAETAKLLRRAHPVWYLCISRDLFFFQCIQEIPDHNKPETWRFSLFTSWLGEKNHALDNPGRLRELKARGTCLTELSRR